MEQHILQINFEDEKRRLSNLIYEEATIKCKHFNKDGIEDEELNDTWSPAHQVCEVLGRNQKLLAQLYMGWVVHRGVDQTQESWVKKLQNDAEAVCRGIASRRYRVFAIILFTGADAQSSMWERFFACCRQLSETDVEVIRDDDLPLDFAALHKHFDDKDYRQFYAEQFRFCPVKLELEKRLTWERSDYAPVLPLHEKTPIGEGSFGTIYRVQVAKGFFREDCKEHLAMKVVDRKSPTSYTEWRLAVKLLSQDSIPPGLMVPMACVRGDSKVYIFMPLASCNLLRLMTHESERDPSLVPSNYQSRIRWLRYMHDLAIALEHLHCNVRSEEQLKNVCIHGDLKSSNILYTREKHTDADSSHPLQISDFGISMFKYSPRRNSTDSEAGTGRQMDTTVRLDRMCPNFPPEAEDAGRGNASIDIWGFGTIFAEYVAWLSGGSNALEELKQFRKQGPREYENLAYYRDASNTAQLKDGIGEWFYALIQRTTDEQDKQLYQSCWYLLRERLLVCNPLGRARIEEIRLLLQDILDSKPLVDRTWPNPPHVQDSPSIMSPAISESEADPPSSASSATSISDTSEGAQSSPKLKSQSTQSVVHALTNRDARTALEHVGTDTDLAWRDPDGVSLLHLTVMCTEAEAVLELLQHLVLENPKLVMKKDSKGETALHKCAKSPSSLATECARHLIQACPETVSAVDKAGRTPLFTATSENPSSNRNARKRMVQLLGHESQKLHGHGEDQGAIPLAWLGRYASHYGLS